VPTLARPLPELNFNTRVVGLNNHIRLSTLK
jgi:hypothetical protein